MIEENKHIDNLFADKLGERTFEVPEAFLADLEKRLDAPKVGSSLIQGFWFWLSALAIAGLTTGVYFGMTSAKTDYQLVSAAKTPLLALAATPSSDQSIFIEVKNNDNKSAYVPVAQYKQTPQAFTPDKQKKLNEVKRKAIEAKRIQDSIAIAEDRANLLALNANGEIRSASQVDNGAEGKNENRSNQNGVNDASDLVMVNGAQTGSDLKYIPKQSALYTILAKDDNFGAKNGSPKTIQYGQDEVSFVDDTLKNIRYILRDSVVIRDSLVIRDSIIYTKDGENGFDLTKRSNKNKSRFELNAHGGFMNVKSKTESPFNTYAELLNSNESKIMSPSFGFDLYWFYRNFSIGTGAEYYHFGEKYDLTTVQTTSVFDGIVMDTTMIIIDSFGNVWTPSSQNPPFDTIPQVTADSVYINDTTSTNYKGQNIYSRFVIPINFGYQFNYKNWAFTPRVGLNMEFTTAYRPGLYTNALNEEILEIDNRKFGISYRLQFEIRRNFDRFHLFVNPYYQNNIGFVLDTPDLKRKYGGFGAHIGIGVSF